jgi:hypothetical protein
LDLVGEEVNRAEPMTPETDYGFTKEANGAEENHPDALSEQSKMRRSLNRGLSGTDR